MFDFLYSPMMYGTFTAKEIRKKQKEKKGKTETPSFAFYCLFLSMKAKFRRLYGAFIP